MVDDNAQPVGSSFVRLPPEAFAPIDFAGALNEDNWRR